jgi:large subunit ribosomal protein L4
MRHAAIRSVLSRKLQDGEILFLDRLQIEQPKTRLVAQLLRSLQLGGKVLVVLDRHQPDVLQAARNIPGLFVTYVDMLNAYDLTAAQSLLVTQAAVEKIEERY